jgi:hypothetical protein
MPCKVIAAEVSSKFIIPMVEIPVATSALMLIGNAMLIEPVTAEVVPKVNDP